MRNKDFAEKETDRMIEKLERKIAREYSLALKEMKAKYDKYAKQFEKDDEIQRQKLADGKISKEDYKNWRQMHMYSTERYKKLADTLAEDLVKVDQKAMSMTKEYMPEAYALNFNYSTYEIEKGTNVNTAFDLYSRETVEKLIKQDKVTLPKRKVDVPKDMQWNKQHINSAILQGVLQGDSIDTISDRLQQVTDMDRRAAVRNARTLMTGAQNGGRIDAYDRAANLGIKIQKEWMATLDSRTRDTHAKLDGERVDYKEEFSNGLQFPGDPDGDPSEVYNCRCTMVPYYPEYADLIGERMTYSKWLKEKENPVQKIVEGKDISATWQRRPDLFDFEIEDVINAQGFDGLPRTVSAEEFDEYVKQANGGEGFIAQRTYSAPDQETLDAYREQLYGGKWYVDCSAGGAQYGQGMYCAADYNGNLTKGIQNEMKHYQIAGNDRIGEISQDDLGLIIKNQKDKANEILKRYKNGEISREAGIAETKRINAMTPSEYVANYMKDSKIIGARSYTETFTLDPSANIISFENLRKIENDFVKTFYEKEIENVAKNMSDIERAMFRFTNIIDTKEDNKIINEFRENNRSEYRDLMEEKKELWHEKYREIRDKVNYFERMDDGAFAAMLGYDAINAEGHGESGSYTVILNRTKLIIRRP